MPISNETVFPLSVSSETVAAFLASGISTIGVIGPSLYTGLVAWYRASEITATAGNRIEIWSDLSSGNHHLQPSSASSAPWSEIVPGTSISALSYPRAESGVTVAERVSNATFPDFGDAYTVFLVAQRKNVAFGGIPGDTAVALEVGVGENANTGFLFFNALTASTASMSFRGRDSVGNVTVTGGPDTRTKPRLYTGICTGTQIQMYTDNASLVTSAYTAPNPNTLTKLNVGRDSFSWQGYVSEIAIYDRVLTANERNSLSSDYFQPWYNL